jgi:hypothetical protein
MHRNIQSVIGGVLMLGLVVFPVILGVINYYLPRQYFSKATVEFHTSDAIGNAEADAAVAVVMKRYGAAADYRRVRMTDLYELGIWDTNPEVAAMNANGAAVELAQTYRGRVKVWEQAEPAMEPARPKVLFDVACGFALGVLSFLVGVVLLITASRRRDPPSLGGQQAIAA